MILSDILYFPKVVKTNIHAMSKTSRYGSYDFTIFKNKSRATFKFNDLFSESFDIGQKQSYQCPSESILPETSMEDFLGKRKVSELEVPSEISQILALNNKKLKKHKLLRKVTESISKLFKQKCLSYDDLSLSFNEFKLFVEIFNKKYLNEKAIDNKLISLDPGYKIEFLQKINKALQSHSSRKRVEENNKFIFKYAVKVLKTRFFKQRKIIATQENEIRFYKHYFEETARVLERPLDHFFDPLYKTVNRNTEYKSINSKYMSIVFASKEFKGEFFNFLRNELYDHYMKNIDKKIAKTLKKLKYTLYKGENNTEAIDSIFEENLKALKKNKKCKLPWTHVEIESALEQFECIASCY